MEVGECATLPARVRLPVSAPSCWNSSVVERHVEAVRVGGSSPSSSTNFGDCAGAQRCLASNAGRDQHPQSPPCSGRRARCTQASVKRSSGRFDSCSGSHREPSLTGQDLRFRSQVLNRRERDRYKPALPSCTRSPPAYEAGQR